MRSHSPFRDLVLPGLLVASLCLLAGTCGVSPLQATELCDQCCDNSNDPELWCSTCQRVCKEKTTKKWVYWCREKQYCQPCAPRLFSSEECFECECTPRTKRVMLKKQVKETHSHLVCELVKPEKPKPAKPADVPPAPPAEGEPKAAKPAKTARTKIPRSNNLSDHVPPALEDEAAVSPGRSAVR